MLNLCPINRVRYRCGTIFSKLNHCFDIFHWKGSIIESGSFSPEILSGILLSFSAFLLFLIFPPTSCLCILYWIQLFWSLSSIFYPSIFLNSHSSRFEISYESAKKLSSLLDNQNNSQSILSIFSPFVAPLKASWPSLWWTKFVQRMNLPCRNRFKTNSKTTSAKADKKNLVINSEMAKKTIKSIIIW